MVNAPAKPLAKRARGEKKTIPKIKRRYHRKRLSGRRRLDDRFPGAFPDSGITSYPSDASRSRVLDQFGAVALQEDTSRAYMQTNYLGATQRRSRHNKDVLGTCRVTRTSFFREKVLTSASRVTSMFLGGEVETAAELRAMAAKSMPAHDTQQRKSVSNQTSEQWNNRRKRRKETYCRSSGRSCGC